MSVYPNYYVIKTREPVNIVEKIQLDANSTYIIPKGWLGRIITPQNSDLISTSIQDYWRPYSIGKNLNGKRLLIQRTSGFGDILFISPLIKEIKKRYPYVKAIDFACEQRYKEILKLIPGIDNHIEVPIKERTLNDYDYHLSFMQLIENGEENDANVYKVYFDNIGILDPTTNMLMPVVNPKLPVIPNNHKKIIGIQPFAAVPLRDLHNEFLLKVIQELTKLQFHVVLLVERNEKRLGLLSKLITPSVSYLFDYLPENYTIVDTASFIKGLDWVLTCDSVSAHLAPALGVKTISIYGPFAANSRTKYYKNSWSIDTNPGCRCRSHNTGICTKYGYPSPCMNVDSNYVIKIIKENSK